MVKKFTRTLSMALPAGQSAFLWGARKTGKSTYLADHFPNARYYDLLQTEVLTKFLSQPHLLREELSALSESERNEPVIIDEIQKAPMLLNEIHWLIENKKIGFILCGSSARKLKRGAANLLGGRAWRFNFYPLIYREIPNFDLLTALNQGLLPSHYLSNQPQRMLRAYVSDYLIEEIQAEGIVRNLAGFARFWQAIGFCNGEMLNYNNIAKDCAIDSKTVKEYFQILVDTLVGYLITPFTRTIKRQLISATPKFYLFDVGVAQHLSRRTLQSLQGAEAGQAFEHFILMELVAYLGLNELDIPIQYWRSKSGLEVDFVLQYGEIAIEVKIGPQPDKQDIKGLIAFCEDYKPKRAIVVCQAPQKRQLDKLAPVPIEIMPWEAFLSELWDKNLIEHVV